MRSDGLVSWSSGALAAVCSWTRLVTVTWMCSCGLALRERSCQMRWQPFRPMRTRPRNCGRTDRLGLRTARASRPARPGKPSPCGYFSAVQYSDMGCTPCRWRGVADQVFDDAVSSRTSPRPFTGVAACQLTI